MQEQIRYTGGGQPRHADPACCRKHGVGVFRRVAGIIIVK
jgi:hypothetical protein